MAYLNLKTCSAIKKHFLAINYVKDGSLSTIKVGLPGGVLYCLQDSDLAPAIEAMRSTPK